MKKDKMLLGFYITSIIIAACDLAYFVWALIEIVTFSIGTAFVFSAFWVISLIIVILNALLLGYIGIYFYIRNRK